MPESYNAFAESPTPLLPARIGELISDPQFGLDPLGYRHPIVAPFRGRERAGLLTTPVSRYYRLDTPRDRPRLEIAAAVRGGDPFIVTGSVGRGRTVLVATDGSLSSVDPVTGEPWTSWPTWPSFLPIVREMLAYAAAGPDADREQPVGTSLRGVRSDASAYFFSASDGNRLRLQMERPDGRVDPVSVHTSRGAVHWNYDDTRWSGIYSLRGSQGGPQKFAVNVNNTESDLTRIEAQDLPTNVAVRDAGSGTKAADAVVGRLETHATWSESFLWMAFLLLFLESFVAWQFGRGPR
jgi:hypothetical protein